MEEVDSIVLRQLQEIGCCFDEEISSLKEMDTNSVFMAAVKCVSLIDNGERMEDLKYTGNMNMGAKYKLANILTSYCQQLGYTGDLGYQTFLYGSETEIRKLFLFLIEKLPKEEIQVSPTTQTQDTVMQRIKKLHLNLVWLPPMDDEHFQSSNFSETQSISNILNAKSIVGNKVAPNKRHYYDNYARIPFNDIASIVEWNSSQLHVDLPLYKKKQQFLHKLDEKVKEKGSIALESTVNEEPVVSSGVVEDVPSEHLQSEDVELVKESLLEKLGEELNLLTSQLEEVHKRLNRQKKSVAKLKQEVGVETKKLVEMKASDKSVVELKNSIDNLKNELEQLTEEWSLASNKLIERIWEIKRENEIKSNKSVELNKELKELRKNINRKSKDIKVKEQAIEELKEKLSSPLPPNRSSYTRRIIEIVNNVKKQNEETKKVLFETRQLQKEINNLSGKVQRSFTITDETIFKDAKSNEWNRKCYKLLATMHDNYDQLLEGVNAIGTIKREVLQLEEAVENEKNNKVVSNLTRIQADLNQMKLENQQIIMKYNALQEQQ